MRGEVRDVRDHPGPPGTTAAVLTEPPTAVVAGALGAVQVLAGLRHGLAVHRGSRMEIIFLILELNLHLSRDLTLALQDYQRWAGLY